MRFLLSTDADAAGGIRRALYARADVRRPPSDFELLRAIYKGHRAEFTEPGLTATATGVMIPIDVEAVAADLGTDADTVWGRLYHHLYGEERRPGSSRYIAAVAGVLVLLDIE
jgi:hypothetical protein